MKKIWFAVVGYIVAGVLFYGLKLAFAILFTFVILAVNPTARPDILEAGVNLATIIAGLLGIYGGIRIYKYLIKQREATAQKSQGN